MVDIEFNSVHFIKLHLRNYGVFLGSNELNFDRHQTFILGRSGTGKTTIVNALAQLGPAQGVKANSHALNPEMSVEVVTKGNRKLVNEYGSVIFLSCESTELPMFNMDAPSTGILSRQNWEAVRDGAREIFRTMLHRKPWKIEPHKDLSPGTMAAGERVCLGYAYAFAVRKVLSLDLPVVLDSPYSRLDSQLRHAVRAFLQEQPYQQILLGVESEFDEEGKLDYVLDYINDYSVVIKTLCVEG